MHEFVFSLAFEPGDDPLVDVLAAHPNARVRSLACHVTEASLWRVDYATGPAAALSALEEAYLAPEYCPDCLVDGCGSEIDTRVLDQDDDSRVFYVRWSNATDCASIPHLALDTLGSGLLFETLRRERDYRWRVVAPDGSNFGGFHVALHEAVSDRATVELERITDVESWSGTRAPWSSLSPGQREAVETAVEHGYYETPREVTLTELAERVDVPRSTLSYRLRRAEARLAKAASDGIPPEIGESSGPLA